MKKCSKCERVYPISNENFYTDKRTKDGLMCLCKLCHCSVSKTYRDNNQKSIAANKRRYLRENRDKINAMQLKYQQENRDKLKRWHKKYLNTDNGRLADKRHKHKRRSLKKGLLALYTAEQWAACIKYFNYTCCYCGEKRELQQDHFIPLSNNGEYTVNNVVPACWSCNSSKRAIDFFKWYPAQRFYSVQREKRILKYLNYGKYNLQQLGLF